jgi:hypothetical protein
VDVFRQPLLRLLAVNLAIGASAAALLLGGLIALNPDRLRDLILADRSPATALGLLLFGFLITFGSVAMGTAVMAIGGDDDDARGRTQTIELPLAVATANHERRPHQSAVLVAETYGSPAAAAKAR